MNRTASAIWSGDLKRGHGALATHSGVLKDTPYSFTTRFEGAQGTNPEELIAAAHAGCFTMALSATLGQAGFTAKRLATQATVTLEQVGGNWTVTRIHLENEAWVPGVSSEKFEQIAADAKANCPISRLLRAEISLNAKLETGEVAA
jgi:osmotically inducible protein OsmC